MPELPDVEVFSKNLHDLFANKKLLKVKSREWTEVIRHGTVALKKPSGKKT